MQPFPFLSPFSTCARLANPEGLLEHLAHTTNFDLAEPRTLGQLVCTGLCDPVQ